jgi:hypothetical protein
MRKLHAAILLVLIALSGGTLWLLLGREPIEEGRCRLKFKTVSQPNGLTGVAYRFLERPASDNNDIRELPQGFDEPFHYHVRAAGTDVPLVVNGADPWTLCLDTNRDGRLSDEKPVQGKMVQIRGWQGQRHSLFGPFELTFLDASGARTTRFHLLGYRRDLSGQRVYKQPRSFAVYPAGYHVGRLRIRGRTYRVAIIDGDYDGRFTPVTFLEKDPARRLRCDYFAIDLNRDGKFERELFLHGETTPLGRMVRLEDTYYAVEIGGNGQDLALRPIDPEKGTLLLDRADCEIECRLWSDAADQWLSLTSDQKEQSLPAGKYSVARLALRARDEAGTRWETACTWKFGALSLFEIKAGHTTRSEMGPPFRITTRIVKRDDGTVFIEPVLAGRAGEEYSTVVRRNGQSVPAPAITIVDEKGTVLVADKFQYG